MPQKVHIAVLDNDESVNILLEDFLTRKGYRVSRLETSQDVLNLISQSNPSHIPDLLVSDVKMKPLDGVELTKQLLRKAPKFPIILFSVYDTNNLLKDALTAGARRLLKKPFLLSEVAMAISEELAKARISTTVF